MRVHLSHLRRALESGRRSTIRIAVFGGSVTAGNGDVKVPYPDRLERHLETMLHAIGLPSATSVEVINFAVPASGTAFPTLCWEMFPWDTIDVVISEFSINELNPQNLQLWYDKLHSLRGRSYIILLNLFAMANINLPDRNNLPTDAGPTANARFPLDMRFAQVDLRTATARYWSLKLPPFRPQDLFSGDKTHGGDVLHDATALALTAHLLAVLGAGGAGGAGSTSNSKHAPPRVVATSEDCMPDGMGSLLHTCASFCNSSHARSHCARCKCRSCSFCAKSREPPARMCVGHWGLSSAYQTLAKFESLESLVVNETAVDPSRLQQPGERWRYGSASWGAVAGQPRKKTLHSSTSGARLLLQLPAWSAIVRLGYVMHTSEREGAIVDVDLASRGGGGESERLVEINTFQESTPGPDGTMYSIPGLRIRDYLTLHLPQRGSSSSSRASGAPILVLTLRQLKSHHARAEFTDIVVESGETAASHQAQPQHYGSKMIDWDVFEGSAAAKSRAAKAHGRRR